MKLKFTLLLFFSLTFFFGFFLPKLAFADVAGDVTQINYNTVQIDNIGSGWNGCNGYNYAQVYSGADNYTYPIAGGVIGNNLTGTSCQTVSSTSIRITFTWPSRFYFYPGTFTIFYTNNTAHTTNPFTVSTDNPPPDNNIYTTIFSDNFIDADNTTWHNHNNIYTQFGARDNYILNNKGVIADGDNINLPAFSNGCIATDVQLPAGGDNLFLGLRDSGGNSSPIYAYLASTGSVGIQARNEGGGLNSVVLPTSGTVNFKLCIDNNTAIVYYNSHPFVSLNLTSGDPVSGIPSVFGSGSVIDNLVVTNIASPTPTPTPIPTFTLSGTVYNDDNKNGIQDSGELGYQGATVSLNTGQTTTTDANGNYSFTNLQQGSYTETLTIPNGYSATTTNPVSLPISANTTQNFGMYSAPDVQTVTVNPNPVQITTAVSATTTFTDADPTDTHTAKVDWGDLTGLHDCIVTESTKSVSCSLPTGYSAANIYGVTIYVYDNDGAQGQATNPNVSVYAPTPSGKFSAGNGYVTPTATIAQNPAVLTSTVQFGLVYKYNGTMPTGDKQFTMTFGTAGTATTTFTASSVTSLVLSNGTGTLTGTGTFSTSNTVYNFLVTGNQNTNTIRIKITDPNTNTVIYDTQPGSSDTAAPTTPVTGPNGKGNGHVIVG